jgi:hypothetical protein
VAAPDPTYVRMFNGRVKWHRDAALREIRSLAQDVAAMQQQAERGGKLFASEARNLASSAAALVERLAALEALEEVSYLTTNPDAEEATTDA